MPPLLRSTRGTTDLFSMRWSPPEPRVLLIVGCTRALPSPGDVVSPSTSGAVPGSISRVGPRKAEPDDLPMIEGDVLGVIGPGGAMLGVTVSDFPRSAGRPGYLRAECAWPRGEVDEGAAELFERARTGVLINMLDPGNDVVGAARYAYRLADRFAALGNGCTNDFFGRRFFAPGGWEMPDADPSFDPTEHVSLYADQLHDGLWLRTHGLIKLGRPELEIFRITSEMASRALQTIASFVDYAVRERPIAPGHTIGNPNRPLLARPGSRQIDYWEGTPVLELVDVDRKGSPFPSGANNGLAAMIWA